MLRGAVRPRMPHISPVFAGRRSFMVYAIIAAALIFVIALVVGLVKGYTKTKTWATEYLFTVILTVLIYSLADLSGMEDRWAAALKVGTAVVFILLFAFVSSRAKSAIEKSMAAARKRSYYKQYGDKEENTLQILDAVETGDRKAYKVLTKRKFPEKCGGAGVANRICGAVTLVIKAAVIFGMAALIVFFVLDLTQLPFVTEKLSAVYQSGAWKFFSKFVMDALAIGILFLAIRCGFRSGVVSVLWVIAVLALIAGAGYLSYWLAFNVDSFAQAGQSLADGLLAGIAGSLVEYAADVGIEITSAQVGQAVLCGALFIVLLIVVIIIGCVVSGIIGRAREGKAFSTVDGVLGAVVAFAVVCAVLLFVGAVLWSINDLSFMDVFNRYMFYTADGQSKPVAIASVFYSHNPLNELEFIADLPVRGWFK